MVWFILARGLFISAVGYSAYQLQPFADGGVVPNVAFGSALGAQIGPTPVATAVDGRPRSQTAPSIVAAGQG